MEKIILLVSGRVQGVGFRYATVRFAQPLGVTGWVRNLSDGRVEMEAYGSAAAIESLLQWSHRGPAYAAVSGVEVVSRQSVTRTEFNEFRMR